MPTGKLYRRGDKWYLDVHTGRKIDGKYERIQRKAQGRTKAEAQAELDELLYGMRRTGNSGQAVNNNHSLQAVCDYWQAHIERTNPNKPLVSSYCIQARRMVEYLGVEYVSEITNENAESALAAIAEKLSTNTANKSLAKLKAALEYAKENGLIVSNPLSKIKSLKVVRKKFRRELETSESKTLLETAPEPWRTFWRFMLSTGVRRDEFLYLRPHDFDPKRKIVRIVEYDGFKPKTDSGNRSIPLKESLVRSLLELPRDGEFLFMVDGKPIRPETLLDVFRKHIEYALRKLARASHAAGEILPRNVTYNKADDEFIVDTGPLDLHSMRYTFITEMIGSGVDPKTVQYLAGHRSIETTLAIYAQHKGGNVRDAISQLPY